MTRSRSGVLTGSPPAFLTHPPSLSSAGSEAVDLAASAGLHLDPWQQHVLDVGLGERADGKWSARQVGVIVPRQNGKGSILEALELAHLLLFGTMLIIHSAHEFKTSIEAFRRILFLIENTPDLSRRVKAIHKSHGSEGVELHSGQRLNFATRTGGGGRGFSGDLIILDEAYNLPAKMISALAPTMAARPNPQLWLMSSAPLVDDISITLRNFCKRGREGTSKGLAYFEWCTPDDADLDDPAAWATANPGYPFRIDGEAIEAERTIMEDDDFARERLGIWHDPEDLSTQVIPTAEWVASEVTDDLPPGPVALGLAVAEDGTSSSLAGAGRAADGVRVQGEVIDCRPGTAWVAPVAAALVKRHSAKLVVPKGSPAYALVKDLKAAGLTDDDLVLLSVQDYAAACGQLANAVMTKDEKGLPASPFVHRRQPELDVALRGAVKRDVGDGAWCWSRKRSSVAVDPIEAVTLAAGQFGLVEPPPPRGFVMMGGGT